MAMITADPMDVPHVEHFAFTPENLAKAKALIANYPPGRQASAVIAAARSRASASSGWLPRAAMDEVAELPRYGADPRLRGRDLLHHVQAASRSGKYHAAGLHHDAVLAARLGRRDARLPADAAASTVGETSAGRAVHADARSSASAPA